MKKVKKKRSAVNLVISIFKWSILLMFVAYPVYLIVGYAQYFLKKEIVYEKQISSKETHIHPVIKILKFIDDNEYEKADAATKKLESTVPVGIKLYLQKFIEVINKFDEIKQIQKSQESSYNFWNELSNLSANADLTDLPAKNAKYLFNNIEEMAYYIQTLGVDKLSSYKFAEIIPFQYIKFRYILIKQKVNSDKATSLIGQCETYLKYISNKVGVLSEKAGIVACIKVRVLFTQAVTANKLFYFFDEKKLLGTCTEIDRLQKRWKNKLSGDNPKYSAQARFLNSIKDYSSIIRNIGRGKLLWFIPDPSNLKKNQARTKAYEAFDMNIPELNQEEE